MVSILVVDDSGFVRKVMMECLRELRLGVVLEASTGASAIERCKAEKIDLIFMDMVLPGKNGVETTAEILQADPHVKVVACSSLNEPWVRDRALNAGCCDYLMKPFTRESIQEMVRSHLPRGQKGTAHG